MQGFGPGMSVTPTVQVGVRLAARRLCQIAPCGFASEGRWSNIQVEVWLPDAEKWNARFLCLGNGGATVNRRKFRDHIHRMSRPDLTTIYDQFSSRSEKHAESENRFMPLGVWRTTA